MTTGPPRMCLDCPDRRELAPGSKSIRCKPCQDAHRRKKQADYQWLRRARVREARLERDRQRGLQYKEREVAPRDLEPRRNQHGRAVNTASQAQLLAVALNLLDTLNAVDEAVADVDEAMAAARAAIGEIQRTNPDLEAHARRLPLRRGTPA